MFHTFENTPSHILYLNYITYHCNVLHILGTVTGLTRGVFAVDFSPDGEHVAIAGGDASIRILKISS